MEHRDYRDYLQLRDIQLDNKLEETSIGIVLTNNLPDVSTLKASYKISEKYRRVVGSVPSMRVLVNLARGSKKEELNISSISVSTDKATLRYGVEHIADLDLDFLEDDGAAINNLFDLSVCSGYDKGCLFEKIHAAAEDMREVIDATFSAADNFRKTRNASESDAFLQYNNQ